MSRGRSPEPIGGNEPYAFGARWLRMVGDRSDPAPGHMAGFGADVAGYAGVYLGRGSMLIFGIGAIGTMLRFGRRRQSSRVLAA
jgi:hypothetical protein